MLHNKMVNSTYKLSWIPLPSNDMLKIDKSTLECIDKYKGCDFGLIKLEEQYHLFIIDFVLLFHLVNSKYPQMSPYFKLHQF